MTKDKITSDEESVTDWLRPLSATYTPVRCRFSLGTSDIRDHMIPNGAAAHLIKKFGEQAKKMLTKDADGD